MGYGFLEYSTTDEAQNALTALNGKPMPSTSNKKTFKLNWASYSSSRSAPAANEYSIYVCELEQSVNEDMLKEYFLQNYPSVIGAKIIVDPSTKISKGYGFVKFSDYNESQRAISEMNGRSINGKPMKTNKAEFKKNAENKKANYYSVYSYPTTTTTAATVPQTTPEGTIADQNFLYQQQQQYLNNLYGYYPNYANQLFYQMYGFYSQPVQGQPQAQPQAQSQIIQTPQTIPQANTQPNN